MFFCVLVFGVGDFLIGRDLERFGGLLLFCGFGSLVGFDRFDIVVFDSGEFGWFEVCCERLLI